MLIVTLKSVPNNDIKFFDLKDYFISNDTLSSESYFISLSFPKIKGNNYYSIIDSHFKESKNYSFVDSISKSETSKLGLIHISQNHYYYKSNNSDTAIISTSRFKSTPYIFYVRNYNIIIDNLYNGEKKIINRFVSNTFVTSDGKIISVERKDFKYYGRTYKECLIMKYFTHGEDEQNDKYNVTFYIDKNIGLVKMEMDDKGYNHLSLNCRVINHKIWY